MKLKLLTITALLSMNTYAAHNLTTIVYNASGSVGETIPIKALHEAEIRNTTSITQSYVALEKITVDGQEFKNRFNFVIPAGGKRRISEWKTLDYHANRTGEWKIEASTYVMGTPSGYDVAYATLKVK